MALWPMRIYEIYRIQNFKQSKFELPKFEQSKFEGTKFDQLLMTNRRQPPASLKYTYSWLQR